MEPPKRSVASPRPRPYQAAVLGVLAAITTMALALGSALPGTTAQASATDADPYAVGAALNPSSPAATAATSFSDVSGGTHTPAIEALSEAGVVRGCEAGRFCPGTSLTRAQLASMLARALELPSDGASSGFPDVEAGSTHAEAIAAAADAGIVQGREDGTFAPDANVDRAQAASMLTRAFGFEDGDPSAFRDVAGSTHEAAVGALVAARVTNGCAAGRFCPREHLRRDQMATFVARALGLVDPAPEPQPPADDGSDDGSHAGLLSEREGYGRHTTGGDGGQEMWVTTTADSGPGSLREAAEASGARWIRFDPEVFPPDGDARIRLDSAVRVRGDATIDGRGAKATIQNHGLSINESNVIVTNLVFDFAAEWTQFQGNTAVLVGWPGYDADRIWVHRNTFVGAGGGVDLQGAVDLLRGTNHATVSWNHFDEWNKTILLATDEYTESEASDLVSIHHNHFERNGQRQPLARFGRFHVYNNWFDHWDWNGSYGEAIVASSGAEVLSERNLFDHDSSYRAITISDEGNGSGFARDEGSYLAGNVVMEENQPGQVTLDPSGEYDYDADPLDTADQRERFRERLRGAGWRD